jgi:hypothetical protein
MACAKWIVFLVVALTAANDLDAVGDDTDATLGLGEHGFYSHDDPGKSRVRVKNYYSTSSM